MRTKLEKLIAQGDEPFSRVISDLNQLFPERSEDTWQQICVALALYRSYLEKQGCHLIPEPDNKAMTITDKWRKMS